MLTFSFRSVFVGVAFAVLVASSWSNVTEHSLTTLDGSRLASYKDPLLTELELNKSYDVAEGPWGSLQYYAIILSYPKSLLADLRLPSAKTHWHFPENDTLAIESLLNGAGFPQTVGNRPWGKALQAWSNTEEGGISVFPESVLLEALTPETRARLAEILRRSPVNEQYHDPVVIVSGDTFSWYKDSGLSEETIQLINKLTYRRGDSLVWSDLGYVSSKLETLQERRTLVRATTRIRSLVLQIKVGGDSDLSAISDYWSSGYKRKAIAPIFESIAGNPHAKSLDVVHLLPPVPRRLLYTFPLLEDSRAFGTLDCHWTAFNFFQSQSLLNNFRGRAMAEQFYERYERIAFDEPVRYGDVIIFVDPQTNDATHSVVYIAGDIVFTKNGESVSSPWIFSRYGDVLAGYGHAFPKCRIDVYRIK